jgi:hypothetical protein
VVKDNALETATQQMTMIKVATAAIAAEQEEDMSVDLEAAAVMVAPVVAAPVAVAPVVVAPVAVVVVVAAVAVSALNRMSIPMAAEKIRGLNC